MHCEPSTGIEHLFNQQAHQQILYRDTTKTLRHGQCKTILQDISYQEDIRGTGGGRG